MIIYSINYKEWKYPSSIPALKKDKISNKEAKPQLQCKCYFDAPKCETNK